MRSAADTLKTALKRPIQETEKQQVICLVITLLIKLQKSLQVHQIIAQRHLKVRI